MIDVIFAIHSSKSIPKDTIFYKSFVPGSFVCPHDHCARLSALRGDPADCWQKRATMSHSRIPRDPRFSLASAKITRLGPCQWELRMADAEPQLFKSRSRIKTRLTDLAARCRPQEGTHRVWTRPEDNIIRKFAPDQDAIRKALPHRTPRAISKRACAIGVKSGYEMWTAEERAVLLDPGLTDKLRARLLPGRSIKAVTHARTRMGLVGPTPGPCLNATEKALLMTKAGRCELITAGRSQKAVEALWSRHRQALKSQREFEDALGRALSRFRAAWLRDQIRTTAIASMAAHMFKRNQVAEAVAAAYREIMGSCASFSLDETIGEEGKTYLDRLADRSTEEGDA